MARLEGSGFSEFDRLLGLVHRTRLVLDALLGEGELPAGGADFLADATLPHVEAIEAGLRGWLRAEMAGRAELRYLVLRVAEARVRPPASHAERVAARAETIAEAIGSGSARRTLRPADDRALTAAAHARLVLGFLPDVPPAQVRFPAGRRTYADIPRPRGPSELVDRVEELERELWRIASGRSVRPLDPALRRTYGFFDAAERLDERTFGPAA